MKIDVSSPVVQAAAIQSAVQLVSQGFVQATEMKYAPRPDGKTDSAYILGLVSETASRLLDAVAEQNQKV
jgi:hypothetical protein